MENRKINIAEILRACPKGMELECALYKNATLQCVTVDNIEYPIKINIQSGDTIELTEYGCWDYSDNAKCIIFPKGKTTWEGFVPPCKFKDGDIVCTHLDNIVILKDRSYYYSTYCGLMYNGDFFLCSTVRPVRLATEEEKQKLFQAIKDKGYKWDAEKKCLEKLKADKFDINTLVPFEDKVLVRDDKTDKWFPATWGFYDDSLEFSYTVEGGNVFNMCITYKGNEHLLGTTEDCDDYFKTWEE